MHYKLRRQEAEKEEEDEFRRQVNIDVRPSVRQKLDLQETQAQKMH